jgi:hypothetical protein
MCSMFESKNNITYIAGLKKKKCIDWVKANQLSLLWKLTMAMS